MLQQSNEEARDAWVRGVLAGVPAGSSLLDVGAGEQPYRSSARHLVYAAQDIANYDGKGTGVGLQTGSWSYRGLDFVCDLLDIPEDKTYDAVLCTEVLEHVPNPVDAIEKLARLVRPGGQLILTAPFGSITHFAPYHFCTGFNRYFYETHLGRLGFDVTVMINNGGFFDYVSQEVSRAKSVYKRYIGRRPPLVERLCVSIAASIISRWARRDRRTANNSSELATFGWHVIAVKRAH